MAGGGELRGDYISGTIWACGWEVSGKVLGWQVACGSWLVDFPESQTLRGLFPLENKKGTLDVLKNSDLALTNPLSGTTPHRCPNLELQIIPAPSGTPKWFTQSGCARLPCAHVSTCLRHQN